MKLIKEDKFLEYAYFFNEYYGTLQDSVEKLLSEGKNVILEIEVLGFWQIKKKIKDFVSVFIYPPSEGNLRERLLARKTESEEAIKDRIRKAQIELKEISHFKYKVLNDIVESALSKLVEIVSKEIGLNS
ncbi:guanylate kinase [Candidatus Mycoplasma haematolamae str. Purdue]|uniref:Guanylate kinase n=1 Tax=Mycoplasma haematolamae (strain Purdue) TaxID=1212765 RepID=I7B8X1_MYCHA|nr:guanylate kinase [Candidatus Mycoplasma haematolamae str. Purdue]